MHLLGRDHGQGIDEGGYGDEHRPHGISTGWNSASSEALLAARAVCWPPPPRSRGSCGNRPVDLRPGRCTGILMGELTSSRSAPATRSSLEVIELALILTLFADGLVVERELLRLHWGPPTRAIVVAMPVTLVLLALGAHALFSQITWQEAFLLGAVLSPTDPVVTSGVVTSQRVPRLVRHTLNLESGLNDGLALPFVLFFLILAAPGGDAGIGGGQAAGRGRLRRACRSRPGQRWRSPAAPLPRRRNHHPLRGPLRARNRPDRVWSGRGDAREWTDRRLCRRHRASGYGAGYP